MKSYKKVYIADGEESALKIVDELRANGIIAYEKAEGAGELMKIYSGMSFAGNAIYVDEEFVDEAKAIISLFEKNKQTDIRTSHGNFSKGTRIAALFCVLILIISIILSIITSVI